MSLLVFRLAGVIDLALVYLMSLLLVPPTEITNATSLNRGDDLVAHPAANSARISS